MCSCARFFNRKIVVSVPPPKHATNGVDLRPGDDYDQRGPDLALILPDGWHGGPENWTRPGKARGTSATWGHCQKDGAPLFRVFTSNAPPLEAGQAYGKFRLYTILNHGGDYSAAAKELARQGYGSASKSAPKTKTAQAPADQPREAIVRSFAKIQPRDVEFLWDPWVPRAAVTLIDGDPGLGKSTITLDLAARISRGWAMPPGAGVVGPPGNVLLMGAEDDPEFTVRPRLDALGADVSRIYTLDEIVGGKDKRPPVLPDDLDLIEEVIRDLKIAAFFLDPLMAFLSSTLDSHRDQDVRRCLHAMKLLAQRTGVAEILVRHLNKLIGGPAIYRGGGSIGIIGAARSALVVGKHPTEPEHYVLAPVKCNLARDPRSLVYTHEPVGKVSRIAWVGETDLKANDILKHDFSGGQKKGEKAADAIRDLLADGPMAAEKLEKALCRDGFSERAIKEGRKLANVVSKKMDFDGKEGWMCSLPEQPEERRFAP
jgi:hypothetical protein